MDTKLDEAERIRQVYSRRDGAGGATERWSEENSAVKCILRQRGRAVSALLDREGLRVDLGSLDILDVGCGAGGVLKSLVDMGGTAGRMAGLDLMDHRVKAAAENVRGADFQCGNCENLPFADEHFDLVLQFSVFTSIFDSNMKQNIAREMLRVLKPDGLILWYDIRDQDLVGLLLSGLLLTFIHPRSAVKRLIQHLNVGGNRASAIKDIKPINKAEIQALFPGCEMFLKSVNIPREFADDSTKFRMALSDFLHLLGPIHTNHMAIIKKPAGR